MPTPLRIRGRKGNKRLVDASKAAKNQLASFAPYPSTKRLSNFEALPTELIQSILWLSLNLDLALASPTLARKLNNNNLRRRFVFLAFFSYNFSYSGHEPVNERWSYYHDIYGPDLSLSSKHLLVNSIIDQAWFSTELIFSCQKEYVSKIVPSLFFDLVNPDFKVATKSWSILQQNTQLPQWFTKVSQELTSDDQISLTDRKDYTKRPLTNGFGWNMTPISAMYGPDRTNITHQLFGITGSERPRVLQWRVGRKRPSYSCSFAVSVMEWYDIADVHLRLVNPGMWTQDNLALLNMITYDYHGNNALPELLDAVAAGLMAAIEQRFLPAVITRSMVCLINDDAVSHLESANQIYDDAVDRMEQGDRSKDTRWMVQWLPHVMHRLIPGDPVIDFRIGALASEHLIKAMEMACIPDMDLASYYIFCWLSVNLTFKADKLDEPFPEDTLRQIHSLALMADTEYAYRCYEFLSDGLEKVFGERGIEVEKKHKNSKDK